ncbi:MAG: diguanylate cyclase, partial [Pseudomonadota bacterium]|nr:diguanylate cyclase [Pseudomonadota bacterium]
RALASVRDEVALTPAVDIAGLTSARLKALSDAIPGVRSMVLLDGAGTVVASSVGPLIGRDFSNRDYYLAPRASPSSTTLYVGAPFKTSLGSYTVLFARTVGGTGDGFAGTVVAALEPEYFEVVMRSVLYAPDMWAALGHGDGMVFVTMPKQASRLEDDWQRRIAAAALDADAAAATPIVIGQIGSTSDIRMTAQRRVAPADLHMDKPLIVTVSRSVAEVFMAWRQQVVEYSVFFMLLGILAAAGLYRSHQRRVEFARLEQEAAQERQTNAVQLEMALQSADLGLWNWDLHSDRFTFHALARFHLGYKAADLADEGNDWRQAVHRADSVRLMRAVEAHLSGETPTLECEFRVRHRDGSWLWLLTRGRIVERDAAGVPVRMTGTHMDVSERKRAEADVARAAEMLRHTGELANIGGWELDLATDQVQWSEQVFRIHELVPGGDRSLDDAISFYAPEAQPILRAAVEAGARDGTPWDLELPFVTARGQPRWVRAQGVAVLEEGKPVRLLGALQDITERKTTALELHRLNEQLRRLSTTDALTEVGNRRLFDQTLRGEWLRSARRGDPVGLLMIDIDHFKDYNDHYGHPAGDACLKQVARMVGESVRRGGELVARYGGEEFALLLPGVDLAAALAVAERCRQRIEGAKIQHRASPTSAWLTVSIGVASQVATASVEASSLIEIADAALYRAKRCGRARIES